MNRKILYASIAVWFFLVNLPQVVPALNRIDPFVIVPFNLFWILGLNLAITILIVWAFSSGGMRDQKINFQEIQDIARNDGLMEDIQ